MIEIWRNQDWNYIKQALDSVDNMYAAMQKLKRPNHNVPKYIKGDYDLSIHGNSILLVDKSDGTTVEARCHPDDNFDIGVGIQEAFNKLNDKRKKAQIIKIGDTVEIVSPLDAFTGYAEWCYNHLKFEDVKCYAYNVTPKKFERGVVIAIAPHDLLEAKSYGNIVAIKTKDNRVYLLRETALKKV